MKRTLLFLSLFMFALLSAAAQPFLVPSNPPPVVQLSWGQSASGAVTNYYLYYGAASQQYTAKVPLGNVTNYLMTLPTRGVPFFFSVTAQAGGLESVFSNEINYTAPAPPSPAVMKPIVVLTVQSSSSPSGVFADAGMNWSLSPDAPQQFYKLKLNRGIIVALTPPPMPTK
jgi:hypothetical protein